MAHKHKAYRDFSDEERAEHDRLREIVNSRMGNPDIWPRKQAPCCICQSPCWGTLMRTHPLYFRTRLMLTEPEVPRHPSGYGILLCHKCQRDVFFAKGFVQLLAKHVRQQAFASITAPASTQNNSFINAITRRQRKYEENADARDNLDALLISRYGDAIFKPLSEMIERSLQAGGVLSFAVIDGWANRLKLESSTRELAAAE